MRFPFLPALSATSLTHGEPSRQDFAAAVTQSLPLSISVFTYGVAYGALAHSANHLGLAQTLAMSIFVFAGASQYTILSLLGQGAAFWTVVSSVFFLNSRQILYGLSLGAHVAKIPLRHLAWLAHGMTDESYSVSIIAARQRPLSAPFLAGAGSAIFFPWLVSSLVGYLIGSFITHPQHFGLDFAYTAAFMGLLGAQLTSPSRITSALVAGGAAIAANHWYGTSGAVFAGAAVSFLMGVLQK